MNNFEIEKSDESEQNKENDENDSKSDFFNFSTFFNYRAPSTAQKINECGVERKISALTFFSCFQLLSTSACDLNGMENLHSYYLNESS